MLWSELKYFQHVAIRYRMEDLRCLLPGLLQGPVSVHSDFPYLNLYLKYVFLQFPYVLSFHWLFFGSIELSSWLAWVAREFLKLTQLV